MTPFDIRNAECRARWLLRYFTRVECADPWEPGARLQYDFRLARKRRQAREWLRQRTQERSIAQEADKKHFYQSLRNNVVAFQDFRR